MFFCFLQVMLTVSPFRSHSIPFSESQPSALSFDLLNHLSNRLQSLDQLLNVWPALRIALRDWKTVNQPPIVGSGGTGGVL